jgi:O-antigen/teichoic acid export membrane protein
MVHQLAVRGADPVLLAEYAAREKARREAEPLFILSTSYLVGIGGACLCLLAVQAEPVVRILFGAGWMEIVPAMRWLCLGTSISLLSASAYQLMLARGLARAAFQCKLVWVPVHLAILLTTASRGIYWMAVGLALSSLVHSILMARALQAQLGVSVRAQLEVVRGSASLVAMVGAGGMAAVLLPAATVPQSFLALCAGTMGAAAGFLLWMRMSGNPLAARLAGHLVALRGR